MIEPIKAIEERLEELRIEYLRIIQSVGKRRMSIENKHALEQIKKKMNQCHGSLTILKEFNL